MFQNNPDRVNQGFRWFKVSLQDKRGKLISEVSKQATEQGSKKRVKKKESKLTKPNICSMLNYNKNITKPTNRKK